MLVHEGLGYNRFGLRYVSAKEVAERRKRVLAVDFSALDKKEPTPPKHSPQTTHQKHLKKMEEDRKAKIRHAQIMSFLALSVVSMSVGLYHLAKNNPSQTRNDILCGATAFAAAAYFTAPFFGKSKQRN